MLERLAKSINPGIGIRRSGKNATVCVAAGAAHPSLRCSTFFMGSKGWTSRKGSVRSGSTFLPYGAGAGSCLAAANVFRTIFGIAHRRRPRRQHRSLLAHLGKGKAVDPSSCDLSVDLGETHLVGLGAIGNGALWAFAPIPSVRPLACD